MRSKLSETIKGVSNEEAVPRSILDPTLSGGTSNLEIQKLEAIDKTIVMQQKVNGLEFQKANLQKIIGDLQNERDDALAKVKDLEEQAIKHEEIITGLKLNIQDLESLNYTQSLTINSIDEKLNSTKDDSKSKKVELKLKPNKSSPTWSPAFMRKNFLDVGSPLLGRKSQVDSKITNESMERSGSEFYRINLGLIMKRLIFLLRFLLLKLD